MSDYDTLSVECTVIGGRFLWKIILKPDAFAKLSSTEPIAHIIPPRPFSYEDEDLLKVIRHMERIVGVTVGNCFIQRKSSCLTLHTGELITVLWLEQLLDSIF